ncbi:hypothetical protein PC129_g19712 [Phytophthora cactorum]|uniref:Uncharacterized protein n=1 Tax=Phytophthora cactorum TaxID=29920 RepID=A0A8T1HAJ4_9STRA|nr:hypothetical protein PC117_g9888 [Phytophthora cactorum]KAG2994787.1 hypothetical protein PC120_g21904 [Phytophthora cactorum]KAG3131991.1 hypothetical protein C6341_g23105 [Phytophthora cactorum]KAG3203697.1 hypothetical protein PC128_g2461 [Phytophthora cactorum]KAG3209273.1 hypothetical protein PC129_g19712 [Phytophthora cactorum]
MSLGGILEDEERRDKRQCNYDIRDHGSDLVDDAPNGVGEQTLASMPASELLSANPMRSAEADARSSRTRTASPAEVETRSSRARGLRE